MQLDIESFTYDEEWLRSMATIEAESADIGAGVVGTALGELIENPAAYSRVIIAQMLVLRVWKDWVDEWSLGVGTQDAQLTGRQLLLERLKVAKPSVQEPLLTIADEKQAQPQGEWQLTDTHQRTIRQAIESVLTQEDWDAISESACDRIHTQIISHEKIVLRA